MASFLFIRRLVLTLLPMADLPLLQLQQQCSHDDTAPCSSPEDLEVSSFEAQVPQSWRKVWQMRGILEWEGELLVRGECEGECEGA